MSRKVNFYNIYLMKNGRCISYNIKNLLDIIYNSIFQDSPETAITTRRIGGKWIRMFAFQYSTNNKKIVIPFGKWKKDNKPYWFNAATNDLEEVNADLFDINSLAYDVEDDIIVMTTNREGPSYQNIEDYLNTLIGNDVQLHIAPVIYNAGIEKIRNAMLVKSLTLKLDLGHEINRFYMMELQNNRPTSLLESMRRIAEEVKEEGEGTFLDITLGVGPYPKKMDTLNIDSTLAILNQLNIGAEFVKEIEAKYVDGTSDKVDIAKIKNSQRILFYEVQEKIGQISPGMLMDVTEDAVADKILLIRESVRARRKESIECEIDINIEKVWIEEHE